MSANASSLHKDCEVSTNGLNVTANVVKLSRLIMRELFGEIVESVAGELLEWNHQHLGSLLRGKSFLGTKDKQIHQKVREALVTLIHHNLVTFSQNAEDR